MLIALRDPFALSYEALEVCTPAYQGGVCSEVLWEEAARTELLCTPFVDPSTSLENRGPLRYGHQLGQNMLVRDIECVVLLSVSEMYRLSYGPGFAGNQSCG